MAIKKPAYGECHRFFIRLNLPETPAFILIGTLILANSVQNNACSIKNNVGHTTTKMNNTNTNQKLIVPLFNVELDRSLQLEITNGEFVERLTAHLFPKPIPLYKIGKQSEGNEPLPIPVPTPKTTIYIFSWGTNQIGKDEISKLLPIDQLPSDFDMFDNLGPFAFRAGHGGLGGFQTLTTASTKQRVKAILIIEFNQIYPESAQPLLSTTNPYESNLTESLLDAIRLFYGNEPHPYKGFHITDSQFVDSVIKWPLMEIQGATIKLAPSDLNNLKSIFLQVWQVRTNSRKSTSCKILTLALEYYYLSATLTETRTIFLHLMIAFESLFKTQDEESASVASSRLAKLLAETKEQYNEIRRFMWNTKQNSGCCQLRNQIVHGGTSSLSGSIYWKLRSLICCAIFKILYLVISSEIRAEEYYESLNEYLSNRFNQLPNN